MKQKIDYWLDTLSPSLLFIAGFFVVFFIYFSWNLGIYSVLFFLYLIAGYYIFFKDSKGHELIKIDETILKQFEEYKDYFSLSQDGLVLVVEDEIQEANSSFEELVGKSISTIRSREWLKLIHEEDLLPFLDWMHFGSTNQEQGFLIRFYNHVNGELLWLRAQKLSIPSLSYKKISILSFKNVSDQKVYQERALESQIQVYTLIDFAPLGVVIFDKKGAPEYVNKYGQNLIGFNRIELLEQGFSSLVSEDKISSFISKWEHFLRNDNESFAVSTTLITKDKKQLEVILNCVAVKNLEGKVNSYFLTIVDLTETQKLSSKNQFFVGLLNNSDAISIVDTNGEIIEANKLFEEKLKITKSDIVGSSYNKYFYGKNGLPEAIYNMKKDDVYRDEICYQLSDKSIWFDRTFIPYYTYNQLESFYVIHRDITERVFQELENKRKNNILNFLTKAQNEFISFSKDKNIFKHVLEKISVLKESSYSLLLDLNQENGLELTILSSYKNSLYLDGDEEISDQDLLNILSTESLFGNSLLFESTLLINNLTGDFGPFDDSLNVARIKNLISFPILRDQKVIGLLILVNSKQKPTQLDITAFEPVTLSLSTMVFAYKEIEIRNQVESENYKLQERISNQLEQLDQILMSSPDTYIVIDPLGKVEFISRRSMSFLQADKFFSVNSSIYDLEKENYAYADLFTELFDKSLKGRNAVLIFSDSNEGKDYLIEFINIKNFASQVSSVLCVIKDITEQKLFERELSVARDSAIIASESKSEYLSSLHEELESPLLTLLNLVNTFESKSLDNDKKDFIKAFKKATFEINNHVERFFNLTVSPMEDVHKKSNKVDISELIKEVFNEKKTNLKNLNISVVEKDIGVEKVILSMNKESVTHVFHSIINFLSEFLKNSLLEYSVLAFEDGNVGARLKIKIVASIPNSYLSYLQFNELGSDMRATLHTLELRKELMNGGTVFSFEEVGDSQVLNFDFYENHALYSLQEINKDKMNQVSVEKSELVNVEDEVSDLAVLKESALIFDHRSDYAATIEGFLSDKSVMSIRANSFNECLEKMQQIHFDYVFLDFSNRQDEFIELAKKLEVTPDVKIIVSTTNAVMPDLKKISSNKSFHFISRPFRKSDLKNIIQ